MKCTLACLAFAALTGTAAAQPHFVTLPGIPGDISADGNTVVGSNSGTYRWTRSGSTGTYSLLLAHTITGPAFCSDDGTAVVGAVPNTNMDLAPFGFAISARWTASTGFIEQHDPTVFFGTGLGNVNNTPRGMTRDGRYIVGFGYYHSSPGGNRPMVHDTVTGLGITPDVIVGPSARILCVSDDATVLGGDDGINGSAQRPAIWRLVDGAYVEQVIETGAGGAGGAGVNCISADGSLASGRAFINNHQLVRWEYNSGTGAYDKVILATELTPPGAALTRVDALAMTPDGQTIFGQYNASRAFVWTAATGMRDLTDTLVAEGMTGMPAGNVIGIVAACSADGREFVGGGGFSAGTPFVIYRDGGACVGPSSLPVPSTTTISMCSRNVTLNTSIFGSGPFTYEWRKNGATIVPGPTGNADANGLASTYVAGFTPASMRINNAGPLDAGSFDCVVTGPCGSVTTDPIVVTAQAADLYDTCAAPLEMIGEQLVSIPMCGLYVNQGQASCAPAQRADAWIRYTPSFTGEARITTCGQPNFDTVLSVHADCESLAEQACDNSYCNSLASIERFNVTAGVPVLVRLAAGNSVPTTPIQLNIFAAPPVPANDTCALAADVYEGTTFGDSREATTEKTAACNAASGKDVWWRYTPSANGTADFDTCTSGFNTVLSLYSDCGQPELACNDNSNLGGCSTQSRITGVPVWAGVPVLVRVGGNGPTVAGGITLTISLTPTTCGSADFDNDGDTGTDADMEAFFACLGGNCCSTCGSADFDADGDTGTDADIEAFFRVLGGGAC